MPGGQYTNLREQATALGLGKRWPDVVKTYQEVNQLLGDIVKVTPSSKCVGDLAIFLITKGVKPEDMVNLPPRQDSLSRSSICCLETLVNQWGGGPKQFKKWFLVNVSRCEVALVHLHQRLI